MKKPIKIVLLCAAFCFCLILSLFLINKFDMFRPHRTEITSELIEQQIQEISELSTLHHQYRKVATYQDAAKLFKHLPNWRINQSIKEFVLIYKGDVKLGYDLKDIKIEVDKITKTITITLPEPKILSHSIDFESINVIMENQGWFNELKFEDFKKLFLEEQKNYDLNNYEEIKRRAREQAQKIIFLYLSSILEIEAPSPSEEKSFLQKLIYPEKFKLELKGI